MIIVKILILYILLIVFFNYINKKINHNLIALIILINVGISHIIGIISFFSFVLLYFIILVTCYFLNKYYNNQMIKIIDKGKINFNAVGKSKYSLEKLTSDLKKNNIRSLSEIANAYIKNNRLIIKKKCLYPVPLILSGEIDYQALNKIGKNSFWLINNMENNNLSLSDIYYAFYIDNKAFFIKKN